MKTRVVNSSPIPRHRVANNLCLDAFLLQFGQYLLTEVGVAICRAQRHGRQLSERMQPPLVDVDELTRLQDKYRWIVPAMETSAWLGHGAVKGRCLSVEAHCMLLHFSMAALLGQPG